MPLRQKKDMIEQEEWLQEALAAYVEEKFPSINKAADYHGVPRTTLKARIAGRPARTPMQKQPKLQLLSDEQETALTTARC